MKGDAEGVRVTVEASGALNSGVDIHPYAAMLRIMLKNEKLSKECRRLTKEVTALNKSEKNSNEMIEEMKARLSDEMARGTKLARAHTEMKEKEKLDQMTS